MMMGWESNVPCSRAHGERARHGGGSGGSRAGEGLGRLLQNAGVFRHIAFGVSIKDLSL